MPGPFIPTTYLTTYWGFKMQDEPGTSPTESLVRDFKKVFMKQSMEDFLEAVATTRKLRHLGTTWVKWEPRKVVMNTKVPKYPPRFPTGYVLQPTENISSHLVTCHWPANPIFREMLGWLLGDDAAQEPNTLEEQLESLHRAFPALKKAGNELDEQEFLEEGGKGEQDLLLMVTDILFHTEGHPLLVKMVRHALHKCRLVCRLLHNWNRTRFATTDNAGINGYSHQHLVSERFYRAMQAHGHLNLEDCTYISKRSLFATLRLGDVDWGTWEEHTQASRKRRLVPNVSKPVRAVSKPKKSISVSLGSSSDDESDGDPLPSNKKISKPSPEKNASRKLNQTSVSSRKKVESSESEEADSDGVDSSCESDEDVTGGTLHAPALAMQLAAPAGPMTPAIHDQGVGTQRSDALNNSGEHAQKESEKVAHKARVSKGKQHTTSKSKAQNTDEESSDNREDKSSSSAGEISDKEAGMESSGRPQVEATTRKSSAVPDKKAAMHKRGTRNGSDECQQEEEDSESDDEDSGAESEEDNDSDDMPLAPTTQPAASAMTPTPTTQPAASAMKDAGAPSERKKSFDNDSAMSESEEDDSDDEESGAESEDSEPHGTPPAPDEQVQGQTRIAGSRSGTSCKKACSENNTKPSPKRANKVKKPSTREVQNTSDAEESSASEDNSSSDGDASASASESEEGSAHEEHESGGTPQAAAMQRKGKSSAKEAGIDSSGRPQVEATTRKSSAVPDKKAPMHKRGTSKESDECQQEGAPTERKKSFDNDSAMSESEEDDSDEEESDAESEDSEPDGTPPAPAAHPAAADTVAPDEQVQGRKRGAGSPSGTSCKKETNTKPSPKRANKMKKPSAREVQTTSDAEESNASEDNSSSDGDARASASESEEGNAHEEHEPGGTPQAAAMQRKARAAPNKGKTRRNGAQNRPVQATQKVEKQLAGDSAQPTKQSTSGSEGDSSEAEGEDHDATSAEFDEDAKVEADVTGGSEWTPPLEQKLEAFFQQLEKAFDKKLDAFFEKQKTQMNNLEASVQKLEESVNSFENSSHEHRAQLKRVHDEVAALKQDRHQLAPSLVPDEQKKRKKSRKCT